MKTTEPMASLKFIGSVITYQLLTYFAAGLLGSLALDYRHFFEQAVIRDYYLPFESMTLTFGPFLQVLRGLLFGLVLLPFRDFLKNQTLGWLWLWLLFVGIGIFGPPAAAPSSLEGLFYTKIPLWFHLVGLPEILLQTLAFSVLVHQNLHRAGRKTPSAEGRFIKALVGTSLSLMGYTLVSLAFAFAMGVTVESGASDLRVLGQFIGPLVATLVLHLVGCHGRLLASHGLLYLASALALGLYQGLILGSVGWVYVFLAPIVPVLISYVVAWLNQRSITAK